MKAKPALFIKHLNSKISIALFLNIYIFAFLKNLE